MTILSIDTSGPSAGVALMTDGVVVSSFRRRAGVTHSETIMPMVEEILAGENKTCRDIDLLACVVGPGSFTGVRIGVCAAKGIASSLGTPVCAVDALEALAYSHKGFSGVICPVLDARRGQVYCAAFRFREGERPERILQDNALPLSEYLGMLPKGEPRLFTGDAMTVREAEILAASGEDSICAAVSNKDIDPAAVCALAQYEKPIDSLSLEPLYLRAPQAERERNGKVRS